MEGAFKRFGGAEMKLKEYKIDLGGSFPGKSEAVQRHAFELGYDWDHARKTLTHQDKRYLYFDEKSIACSAYSLNEGYAEITVEKFLELTKEDVIKKEPELFYRYRIWLVNDGIVETSQFYEIKDDYFVTACGIEHYHKKEVIKYERIGEGVARHPQGED
jgi:hypothetical protein